MNQWHPGWDTRPDDYRAEASGPYTPPPTPAPRRPKQRMPRWAKVVTAILAAPAILAGALFGGFAATTLARDAADPAPVESGDPTYDAGLYTPETPHFTPNTHKPGPKVRPPEAPKGLDGGGLLVVGPDVEPGVYRAIVVPRYWFGREDSGYCYVSRLNTTRPDLSDVRTAYDYAPTGPIIADASYRETGQLVTLKILATDKAVEIDCGDARWLRVDQ